MPTLSAIGAMQARIYDDACSKSEKPYSYQELIDSLKNYLKVSQVENDPMVMQQFAIVAHSACMELMYRHNPYPVPELMEALQKDIQQVLRDNNLIPRIALEFPDTSDQFFGKYQLIQKYGDIGHLMLADDQIMKARCELIAQEGVADPQTVARLLPLDHTAPVFADPELNAKFQEARERVGVDKAFEECQPDIEKAVAALIKDGIEYANCIGVTTKGHEISQEPDVP